MSKRVAIFQNTITGGGRIQVLNAVIRILNANKIEPDIYTLKINKSFIPEKDLMFRVIPLRSMIKGMSDLKIASLNAKMVRYQYEYDLLVNSNNSFLKVPRQTPTIAYIHFPRKARIFSEYQHLAFPDVGKINHKNLIVQVYREYLKKIYKNANIPHNQFVFANSEFTKQMIQRYYPDCNKIIKVIYPPVDIEKWRNEKEKIPEMISSLGRFSKDKRQLEQIKIARAIPILKLNIIGFVGDRHSRSYFNLCKKYLETNQINNVKLYPNLPFEEAKELLTSSKFFIHSLRNEPFGISSVEAIAAGCIPIVHDSGGQQEIVNFRELRYKDQKEATQKINQLLMMDTTKLQKDLFKNNSRFNIDVFNRQMRAVLFEKSGNN